MNDINAKIHRSVALLQQGHFDKAIEVANDVIRWHPRQFDALHVRALASFYKRDIASALRDIEQALSIRKDVPDSFNTYGMILRARGRFDDAIRQFKAALERKPSSKEALYNIGNCYQDKTQYAAALDFYDKALGLDRKFLAALNNKGIVLAKQGQHAAAVACFNDIIRTEPRFAEAYYNRGDNHAALKNYEAAILDYDAALKLRPLFPSAHCNRANALRELGRLTEAHESYNRAIAQDPRFAEAYIGKALVLNGLRRFDDAITCLDTAIQLRPDYAEAYSNRGNALKELGRLEEALASYEKSIHLKPDYAEAHRNRGNALRELRQFEQALDSYEKAISLKPDHAEAYNSRGNVLKDLGQPEQALASYEKAINLKPSYGEAYCNHGNVLRELGRIDEARASYEKASSLRPEDILPLIGLAQMDSENGKFKEAEAKYNRARLLDPSAVVPLCGIAEVRKFESTDSLILEFRELLASTSLSEEDRAQVHHAYAKICDDLGLYDESMKHTALGKKLLKAGFAIDEHRLAYATMKRLFTRQFFAERSNFGILDERPVFIVGMPRSGTTLTEQILASHHLVEGLGELRTLPQIITKWCGRLGDPLQFASSVSNLSASDIGSMAQSYLDAYKSSRKDCIRLIDKQTHNYEWLGLIALMFPKAHIIHCRRDPLDTCVSMYMLKFSQSHSYNQDLDILGRYYREYAGLMDHWSEVLPLPIHDCSYEKLVSDFDLSARSLVSFLDLEWDPNCLDYHQQDRQVSTPSRWQVRQPLYGSSIGRWRRYEQHLGPLKEALADHRAREVTV